jgi:hypothetical protein
LSLLILTLSKMFPRSFLGGSICLNSMRPPLIVQPTQIPRVVANWHVLRKTVHWWKRLARQRYLNLTSMYTSFRYVSQFSFIGCISYMPKQHRSRWHKRLPGPRYDESADNLIIPRITNNPKLDRQPQCDPSRYFQYLFWLRCPSGILEYLAINFWHHHASYQHCCCAVPELWPGVYWPQPWGCSRYSFSNGSPTSRT